MGLSITVGILAQLIEFEEDQETIDDIRGQFEQINELLARNGLPRHVEPDQLPPPDTRSSLDSVPYSFLHRLRRAYAHRLVSPTWTAKPLGADVDPSQDPVVSKQTARMESHLLCHSDCEGCYVPVDFQPVLHDDTGRVPGEFVCSSHRLLDELVFVAPALGIPLNGNELSDEQAAEINRDEEMERGLWIERATWLTLYEAARRSIRHKAAIWFA